jgi:hypothetical protein
MLRLGFSSNWSLLCYLAMVIGYNGINVHKKCRQINDDFDPHAAGWGDTAQCALPNGAHLWLHAKPLDAIIRQMPAPYCSGGRHGHRFPMKPKNTNNTQPLPSFLMVDQRKKAKQFRDPKQTLYSHHQCNKLHTNVKHHYLSWRAQLHFELSNVVNGKIQKVVNLLNKAQENLWAKYGPIAVKLLTKLSESKVEATESSI